MVEEATIFHRYKETGDVAVRNEIVEKYLYIASVLAKKFVGRGVEYDDLYQVATLALIKGVERYDPDKGVQFSTFITPTITGEIKNYFRDRGRLIRLPRKVAELRANVKKRSETMLAELGRKPTAGELAESLGVSEEDVVSAMEAGSVVSLDRPARGGEGENGNYYDVLPAEDNAFERVERDDAIASAVQGLSERERELVKYRFGGELSQSETARRMGVSQMYVSRLERKVLEKLRENLRAGMD